MSDIIESIHCQNIDLKQREIYLHGQHGSFDDDPVLSIVWLQHL